MNRWAVVETQENVPLSVRWAETREVAVNVAAFLVEKKFGQALRLAWRQGLEEVLYYEHGLYRVQAVETKDSVFEPSRVRLNVALYDASGQLVEKREALLPAEAAEFAGKFMELHGTDPDEDGAGAQPGSVRFRPAFGGVRRYDVSVELAIASDTDFSGRKYADTVRVVAGTKKGAAAKARDPEGPVGDLWPGAKNVRVLSVREVERGE